MTNVIDLHSRQPVEPVEPVEPQPLHITVTVQAPPPPPSPLAGAAWVAICFLFGFTVVAALLW